MFGKGLLKILLIILIIYFIYKVFFIFNENKSIRSQTDNNLYIIRRGNNKSNEYLQHSANILGIINLRILKLIQHLNNIKTINNTYWIDKLSSRYKYSILSEAAIDERYTTFTINKNDMHICLRTRDDKESVYDINILMYVIIHELAHLCNFDKYGNPIQGHGIEFKRIFKFLIEESINIGIYDYQNYNDKPVEYCGIIINTNILSRT
jgi:predicted metal-dependent hydrolase